MPVVVGLLSDSHSRWERTRRALEALQRAGATRFIHCGDIEDERVLDQLAGLEVDLVWGNCDWHCGSLEPYARNLGIRVHGLAGEIDVDGRRIAFTHGHEPAPMREVLGSEFIDVYQAVKRNEYKEFLQVISPWEREHLLLNV